MKLKTKRVFDYWIGGLLLQGLGFFTRRQLKKEAQDLKIQVQGPIVVVKLLGGGSLILAYPSLLAIRRAHPQILFSIVTTPSLAPFAQTLGIFDRIFIIDDRNLATIFMTSLKVIGQIFGSDTILDYEVHSRLTPFFSFLCRATNRVGIVIPQAENRSFLLTHPLRSQPVDSIFTKYDEMAELLSGKISLDSEIRDHYLKHNELIKSNSQIIEIAIGSGCSDLSRERMLSAKQWRTHFRKHVDTSQKYRLIFLGSHDDFELAEKITQVSKDEFLNIQWLNLCGQTPLIQAIGYIFNAQIFWGVDSALLHIARLVGTPIIAYFGPTSPMLLLRNVSYLKETIHYIPISCSPCVHVNFKAPCGGDNQCISGLFSPEEGLR